MDMLKPIPGEAWNELAAAHLLSRAGFGAVPEQIARAAKQTPQDVVGRLLDFVPADRDPMPPPDWLTPEAKTRPNRAELRLLPDEERREAQRAMQRRESTRLNELRAWWLHRMRCTTAPLQEKLTLFWHGHFATSARKVRSTYALYQQNETFRRHGHGSWRDLLLRVAQDPAMLIYLDGARSHRRAPNENFARELMELFTLGEGHYTEEDIKEAARAFTGWTLSPEAFSFARVSRRHDPGVKTFFNREGPFEGEDIIDIILAQPAAARHIVRKLWAFFAYEDPEEEVVEGLARQLRDDNYELRPVLRSLFLSRAFYASRAVRTQVKSPVQWLIGTAVALETPLPPGRACARALDLLGQELFAPPNVKGWDGGVSWITTATLLHRYNFAGTFVGTGPAPGPARVVGKLDPLKVLPREMRTDTERALRHLEWRLFQGPLREQDRALFRACVKTFPPAGQWDAARIRKLLHSMMSTPQYQLT